MNWTSTTILVKLDYERPIGMYYCASRRRRARLLLTGASSSRPGRNRRPASGGSTLAIEGQDARAVALAKAEMKRVLNEETLNLAAGGSQIAVGDGELREVLLV